MIISHSQKFIFIHVQRTGGSTVISHLKEHLGRELLILSQHGNAQTGEAELLHRYPEYYKFAFVRNPWDRMFSWFTLTHKDKLEDLKEVKNLFEEFLEKDRAAEKDDKYFHYNQLDYFNNDFHSIDNMAIYRFENYSQEIRRLFRYLGFPLMELAKMNKAAHLNYKSYYTERSKELIREKCKKDLSFFNYTFD